MRLIDAEEAYKVLTDYYHHGTEIQHDALKEAIERVPTVDPVKHGEWRYDEALELEWCSECGFGKRKGDKRWYSYCPNCGAYMEVEDAN